MVLGGIVLTVAVLRGSRSALAVSTFLLGAQLLGCRVRLATGARVDAVKAGELRELGFDPRFGAVVNLTYSALASLVFGCVVARWWATRQISSR